MSTVFQMSNAVCGSDPTPTSPLSNSPSPNILLFLPPFHSLLFPLCFSPINCLSLFTLLMLVEGSRANAVNVSGFKALQMSVRFFFWSAKSKPRLQQICQLQVRGQVCVSYLLQPLAAARICCKHVLLYSGAFHDSELERSRPHTRQN